MTFSSIKTRVARLFLLCLQVAQGWAAATLPYRQWLVATLVPTTHCDVCERRVYLLRHVCSISVNGRLIWAGSLCAECRKTDALTTRMTDAFTAAAAASASAAIPKAA